MSQKMKVKGKLGKNKSNNLRDKYSEYTENA